MTLLGQEDDILTFLGYNQPKPSSKKVEGEDFNDEEFDDEDDE